VIRAGLRGAGVAAVVLVVLLLPAVAAAHPLGNFTINHFAGLHIAPDRVLVDLVIDRAEIPAFQERRRIDLDANGTIDAGEADAARWAGCAALVADLRLAVDGTPVPLAVVAAGISFPEGAGGLPTMRLVCELEGALSGPLARAARVEFEDRSFAERIGWREIVVVGNGVRVEGAPAGPIGAANRLTAYPADLLAIPPEQRSISVAVTPAGIPGPAWRAPDAEAVAGGSASPGKASSERPRDVGQELAALVDAEDLTPAAILASLLAAIALGIVHAVSPGHGKTIMAAYLVGGRGTARQALGLGMAVAVSHTVGVVLLALITIGAAGFLPPERLYPVLAVVSGGLVVVIGTSLLWARARQLIGARQHARAHEAGHAHDHDHPHPADAGAISWRGLVALGLSGGLLPSASALILLLGSIAAGRIAYGLVLVLGFGLGMALVLAGLGLIVLRAGRWLERAPAVRGLGRLVPQAQLGFAALVVVLGLVLTGQAVAQVL